MAEQYTGEGPLSTLLGKASYMVDIHPVALTWGTRSAYFVLFSSIYIIPKTLSSWFSDLFLSNSWLIGLAVHHRPGISVCLYPWLPFPLHLKHLSIWLAALSSGQIFNYSADFLHNILFTENTSTTFGLTGIYVLNQGGFFSCRIFYYWGLSLNL